MAKRNPIKGPGKFEGELYLTRYAHENPDDAIGSVDELGWYGKLSGKVKGRGPFHVIVSEDSQGFVYGKTYPSNRAMEKAWAEIEADYDDYYSDAE